MVFLFSLSPQSIIFNSYFETRALTGDEKMTMTRRILISLGILLTDLVVFFLPLTAIFLIYILLYNPPWFRTFLNQLDRPSSAGKS